MVKKILLLLLLVFVIIQFFRPTKNVSTTASTANITDYYTTSEEVKTLLKNACYDCHSNITEYPWYSNIQPFGWVLSNHVVKGKKKFNFDDFMNYNQKRKDHKLDELVDEIQEGEMPLKPYALLHKEARLTDVQKQQLIDWANNVQTQIAQEPK